MFQCNLDIEYRPKGPRKGRRVPAVMDNCVSASHVIGRGREAHLYHVGTHLDNDPMKDSIEEADRCTQQV